MPRTRKHILTGRRPSLKKKHVSFAMSTMSTMSPTFYVPMFLNMLHTVKLYHWKTMSFATHKATDELYASLNEKIDHFVEVMLGKDELGGRAKLLNVTSIKLDVFSNNAAFKKQINIYKNFLLQMSQELDAVLHADLLAIRDEILADFNKFLYLLTLGG
jgi:DNA-binding ferritin-like protein